MHSIRNLVVGGLLLSFFGGTTTLAVGEEKTNYSEGLKDAALTMLPPPERYYTPLHDAAKACDVETAQRLIPQTTDLDQEKRLVDSPLVLAAECGCLPIVERLVEGGATVDLGRTSGDRTALASAAEQGHADVVRYLLGKGAAVDARTNKGDTPLILALKGSLFPRGPEGAPLETVIALLQSGADPNAHGEVGQTPLMWAMQHLDARLIWVLLQKGADALAKDDDGETAIDRTEQLKLDYLTQLLKTPQRPDLALHNSTPLSDAVRSEDLSAVAEALRMRVDVDARVGNGSTALMLAAAAGRTDMAELLLQNGAAINAVNGGNATALSYAATAGHAPMVKLLLAKGANLKIASVERTPLLFAVRHNHVESAGLLLDAGANPNELDAEIPLLHKAITEGYADLAELLIAKGAALNAGDEQGKAPLHLACERGDLAIVKALLAKGVDIKLLSQEGEAPLTLAIAAQHDEIARLLLARGAEVRQEDLWAAIQTGNRSLVDTLLDRGSDVKHALLTALPGADLDLVRLLTEKGADPNARGSSEKTPLILETEAWSEAKPAVLRYLLDQGAAVNAQDDRGMSALMIAAGQGNSAVAQLLLQWGADLTLKSKSGKSAWMLAAERADRPLLEKLEQAGAAKEYAGMQWEGMNAERQDPFIKVVTDRTEWETLWQQTLAKPAPIVDFAEFAVACVFLGESADWLYSINFGQPQVQGSVVQIPYTLIMLNVEMSPRLGLGQPTFGGQYAMQVFAKPVGLDLQLIETSRDRSDWEPGGRR